MFHLEGGSSLKHMAVRPGCSHPIDDLLPIGCKPTPRMTNDDQSNDDLLPMTNDDQSNRMSSLPAPHHHATRLRFQKLLGDRWGVRGSIGLGLLPLAVQFIVFRLVLVENLPPKRKQSITAEYDPWISLEPWDS